MNIEAIAKTVIARARRTYGSGWQHASRHARRGCVAEIVITDFESFGASHPASDVAAVMRSAWAKCEDGQ